MKNIVMSWSSGKDAAYALYKLQQGKEFQIHGLFCTLDNTQKRDFMQGVQELHLKAQAKAEVLRIVKLYLAQDLFMVTYGAIMKAELIKLKQQQVHAFGFGDILLEDIKAYREKQLTTMNMEAIFPLWEENTKELAHRIIDAGFKAIVVAINRNVLDDSFIGRSFNAAFLESLPVGVDPCGENGEFHTFVYDGPNFRYPIAFKRGGVVERSYASDSDAAESWDTSFLFLELLLT